MSLRLRVLMVKRHKRTKDRNIFTVLCTSAMNLTMYKIQKFLLFFLIVTLLKTGVIPLYAESQDDLPDPEPDRAAVILNRMAELCRISGEYKKAEALYQRSLVIHEMIYGPEHAEVAAVLHNMGLLYHTVKDYKQAEEFYKRALAIREKVHGAEDLSVAATLNTLAGLYDSRGDYALSEPLYRRALMIDEKIYGPDHPDVAIDLKNLALLCHLHGEYEKAEPLYQRALLIEEKIYGSESETAAMTLNHLGGIHYLQEDYGKAEQLYQRALSIKEKIYGKDTADTAVIMYNLGNLYQSMKKYDSAESFYCRVLEIAEIYDMPYLKWRVQNDLSQLLDKQKFSQASVFFSKQAVNNFYEIQDDLSENELKRFSRADKKSIYKNLVNLLIDQDRLSEAQDVLATLKKEHPAEKTAFNDIEQKWVKDYGKIREQLTGTGKPDSGISDFLQKIKTE